MNGDRRSFPKRQPVDPVKAEPEFHYSDDEEIGAILLITGIAAAIGLPVFWLITQVVLI